MGLKNYFTRTMKELLNENTVSNVTGKVIEVVDDGVEKVINIANLDGKDIKKKRKSNKAFTFLGRPIMYGDYHTFTVDGNYTITDGSGEKYVIGDTLGLICGSVEGLTCQEDKLLVTINAESVYRLQIDGKEKQLSLEGKLTICSDSVKFIDDTIPNNIKDMAKEFSFETALGEIVRVNRGRANIFTLDPENKFDSDGRVIESGCMKGVHIIGIDDVSKKSKNPEYRIACYYDDGPLMYVPIKNITTIIYTVDVVRPLSFVKNILNTQGFDDNRLSGFNSNDFEVGNVYKIKKTNGTKIVGACVTVNYDSVIIHTDMGIREIPFTSILKIKKLDVY